PSPSAAPSNGTPRSSTPTSADSWRSTPTARSSETRTESPNEEQGPKRMNAQPAHDEELHQFETSTQVSPPGQNDRPLRPSASGTDERFYGIASRVLRLAPSILDRANRGRTNPDGVKVGGHPSSSASMTGIMTALWFTTLRSIDRVSVKPHASPVLHAINYLLGDLDVAHL